MGMISRLWNGNEKCTLCSADGPYYVAKRPYCAQHKKQMSTIAGGGRKNRGK